MSGFKIFNVKWIVSTIATSGSYYEDDNPESGKIINANGTYGYTDDSWGVKRLLEDFCAPLCELSKNQEGWQLDEECCEKDEHDQPIREARLLKPNNRVYVMYFKHTSGARLMLGMNYFSMLSYNTEPGYFDGNYNSSNYYYDIGFISNKCQCFVDQPTTTGNRCLNGGGIFMAMIPPTKNGQQEKFNPELSIQNPDFYPQTMTPVQYLMNNADIDPSYEINSHYASPPCSLLKQGTNDTSTSTQPYNYFKNYGFIVGLNMKLSLFVSGQVVGFTGRYKNYIFGRQICGKILSDCRNTEDNLSTSEYGLLSSYCGSNSGNYCWQEYTYYCAYNMCCNTNGTYWTNMFIGYNSNGYETNSTVYEYIYPGYVKGYDPTLPVSINGQTKARLRDDLFAFTDITNNKTYGQTYNDGQWIFFTQTINCTNRYSVSPNGQSRSSYLLLRWDGEFNGTETF